MPLLATHGLTAFYGDFQALFGVDTALDEGETIAVIGANGAGKSTFLKSIAGLLPHRPESVVFDGQPIGALPPAEVVRRGISLVPEGRRLFPSLNVEENLVIGTHGRSRPGRWTVATVTKLFPVLQDLRRRSPSTLSGGEQQMVAIARGLMSNPRVLLCDEISLGLAPVVVADIYRAMPEIKQSGTSIVIVEQDVSQALGVSDRVYCLREGRVTLSGKASELRREAIHVAYFGR